MVHSIAYGLLKTDLGTVGLGLTQKGLCFLHFFEQDTQVDQQQALTAGVLKAFGADCVLMPLNADQTEKISDQIQALLNGKPFESICVDFLTGTPFQKKVWHALTAIPLGQTRTYSALAQTLDCPKAVRAVASACARNNISLFVPCHRVIRKGGDLAGYRWGLSRKKALLQAEGALSEGGSIGSIDKITRNTL